MRLRVIFFLGVISSPWCATAEIIHLKNGRTIWADQVRQKGSHLEYEVGDNSYAIPQSLIDRIEAGGVPPQDSTSTPSATSSQDLPVVVSTQPLASEAEVSSKVLRDGRVDAGALSALEDAGNTEAAAAGYFIAARNQFEHGNLPQARSYYEHAMRFRSDSPVILENYAALLIRMGSPAEALPHAERAARMAPNSADAFAVLGFAQYSTDRSKDAIRSWKRSLELRPDSALAQFLAKAQRELSVENDFSQRESSHFTLRYEGKQTSESLRRALLATLESQFEELSRALGIIPHDSIPVVLYTDQAFFDVTQAPSWSGAVNDGKLRIPVNGLSSVTPELARVLKHELAHSFINRLSRGRCPNWLHEGIAQLLEPKSLAGSGRRLAQLFHAQRALPFNSLEGSFLQFSPVEALLAYDQSLAAVQYIEATYGMGDLQRILQRIGDGTTPEMALRTTIHADYGLLETDVGKFLSSKYGE